MPEALATQLDPNRVDAADVGRAAEGKANDAPRSPSMLGAATASMGQGMVQRKLAQRWVQRKANASPGARTLQRKDATQAGPASTPDADHTLSIQKGELTATGEGNDAATKFIHWPNTAASGVTLGKGYDIGSRSAQQVTSDLTAAGMPLAQATKISKGAGLTGAAAGKFVSDNKADVGEIPRDVQYALLSTMLGQYTDKAQHTATDTKADTGNHNAAGREAAEGKPAGTYVLSGEEWSHLHPALVELLTDLTYQGGYYGWDRVAKINAAVKAHDGNQLEQLKAVRQLFTGDYMDTYAGKIGEGKGGKGSSETFFGQKVDLDGKYRRNQIRLAYLNEVISAMEAGKEVVLTSGANANATASTGATNNKATTPAPTLPSSGATTTTAPATPAPAPTTPAPASATGHATTLVALNVRATAGLDGKKLGLLNAGTTVDVSATTPDGWLQISYQGKPAFISGSPKYVAYQAGNQPAAATQATTPGKQSPAPQSPTPAPQTPAPTQAGPDDAAHATTNNDPLATLMAQNRLTPEQIAQARALIDKLPQDQRAAQFLQLQSKSEYVNQRDNASADEVATGGTCNLSSLAMCLEYLGISNPLPNMRYADALVKIAHDNKYGDITYNTTWEKVAKHVGATMKTIVIGDQKVSRSTWEQQVRDQHLAAGHSVLCSIVGHIVRVQSVGDSGVVVDNPYGLETIGAGTGHTWVRSNSGKNGLGAGHKENEGEDNTWPWANVEAHTFRSVLAFQK